MSKVDPTVVASVFADIASAIGRGEMVTISIMKNGDVTDLDIGSEGAERGGALRSFADEADLGTFAVARAIAKFALDQDVRLSLTGSSGKILALTHYADGTPPRYLVRFARNGEQLEDWFDEDALDGSRQDAADDRPARPSR